MRLSVVVIIIHAAVRQRCDERFELQSRVVREEL